MAVDSRSQSFACNRTKRRATRGLSSRWSQHVVSVKCVALHAAHAVTMQQRVLGDEERGGPAEGSDSRSGFSVICYTHDGRCSFGDWRGQNTSAGEQPDNRAMQGGRSCFSEDNLATVLHCFVPSTLPSCKKCGGAGRLDRTEVGDGRAEAEGRGEERARAAVADCFTPQAGPTPQTRRFYMPGTSYTSGTSTNSSSSPRLPASCIASPWRYCICCV